MSDVVKRSIFTLTERAEARSLQSILFRRAGNVVLDENLICILSREQNLSAGWRFYLKPHLQRTVSLVEAEAGLPTPLEAVQM